ncbi:chlorophyll synthesis pathway protein BchC [Fonsecaea pedrosoi CBS 271.37]|uniref:Chlorophyll synthesis pathway protein BchC n=1 Tax=Fonsecaea pedrosoi CBS 271.37 TaxID=1442368 RepID=A0A0D2G8Y2_9EURO|nr:chlorophyll synthesis pathway protein BchC [Fonsecaea pedrosoi CBS 271.37]KIW77168.1 chlorophyll synthesis pathway protein BchC [Fonsecaea pedrosoi CBS 271.37]
MKAARYYGVRDVRVEDVQRPQPKDGEILVQIAWCGICGSDLKNYTAGSFGTPTKDRPDIHTGDRLPVTLGHEACGRVAETTAGCPLKVGQAVVIDPRLYCLQCRPCLEKNTHLCDKPGFLGLSGGGGGGFSEYVAVRWQQCYPVPDSLLDNASLIEPLAVARHGLRVSKLKSFQDKTALVLGGGPIGQAVIHNLKAAGTAQILVSEPAALRKAQAANIPSIVLDPKTTNVAEEVKRRTDGVGADVVFDCAGVPSALLAGIDALKKRGTYVMIASWDKPIEVPLVGWMSKEITLEAALAYSDEDFRGVVDDFVAGKFQGAEKMITSRIVLNDFVQQGLQQLLDSKDACVKVLVTPTTA